MPDLHGVVKERTLRKEVKITVSNVMDLDLALKRRGVALEEKHDFLRQRLVGALVADSPGARFSQVSVTQVRNADIRAWQLLSKLCRRQAVQEEEQERKKAIKGTSLSDKMSVRFRKDINNMRAGVNSVKMSQELPMKSVHENYFLVGEKIQRGMWGASGVENSTLGISQET